MSGVFFLSMHAVFRLIQKLCHTDTKFIEKLYASMGGFCAILVLSFSVSHISVSHTVHLLILGSMGASTFLLFVTPHSPMAQPWPVYGGHLISAITGVSARLLITDPSLALATAVGCSILLMYLLRCLHPPGAATAMIAVAGGIDVNQLAWAFVYIDVASNVAILLLLAWCINNLIPGRFYPLNHRHHPHHEKFKQYAGTQVRLTESDFQWALQQMGEFIDVSEEELVDLYEFAYEHKQRSLTTATKNN